MLALLALTTLAPTAHAEDVLPASGWTVALPLDEVVGDGATPVTAHVLALKPDGTPIEGLVVKLKSKTAEASSWAYQGGGIYSFSVTPPQVDGSDVAWVRVKGKTADKLHKIDLNARVPLRKTPPLAMNLAANPSTLMAGEVEESSLSFTLADGRNVDPKMLNIKTSVGEVGEIAAMGNGRYVAKLTIKGRKNPGLALITVSDKRRPERVYGALTLPISAKRTLNAKAKTGASVMLKVAGRDFGPVTAKGGRARIDEVVLPPGVVEATQITVVDDAPSETAFDLGIKPDQRMLFVPSFEGIPADPDIEIPIRLLVVKADGSPDSQAKPEVQTDAGTVSSVRHEGRGLFIATLKPSVSAKARTTTISASLPDEPKQAAKLALNLAPTRPQTLSVSVDPSPLGEARQATISASMQGPGGVPMAGRDVRLNLTGAKAIGEPKLAGEGLTQPVQTFGGPVEIRASALTPASGNPVHQLVVVPSRTWLANDAISSTMVTVVAVDIFGYPVSGVAVRMDLEVGDGSVPREVVTDAYGLGQVFYTAGSETRIVRIRAVAGDASAAFGLVQGPRALSGVALPVSGSDAQRAVTEAWAKTLTTTRVETE
ncbi:MAG: hypothetical protein AB8H79_16455 [Myxococcota bacterium]